MFQVFSLNSHNGKCYIFDYMKKDLVKKERNKRKGEEKDSYVGNLIDCSPWMSCGPSIDPSMYVLSMGLSQTRGNGWKKWKMAQIFF